MEPIIKTVELHNHVKLPYVEQGSFSGFPLVLLHGYADSWHSFERVLPYLPESIRVFALTQRGHGDASRPTTGYQLRDFTTDLVAFMESLPPCRTNVPLFSVATGCIRIAGKNVSLYGTSYLLISSSLAAL